MKRPLAHAFRGLLIQRRYSHAEYDQLLEYRRWFYAGVGATVDILGHADPALAREVCDELVEFAQDLQEGVV